MYKPYEQENKRTIGTAIQGKHWKIGSRILFLHVISRKKINKTLNNFEAEITKTAKQLQDESQNRRYLLKTCSNHFPKFITLVPSILILKSRLSSIISS